MFKEKSERVVSQDTVGSDLFQGKSERIPQSRGGGMSKRLGGIVCGTYSVLDAGLSFGRRGWYMYDWDTGSSVLI